jgi:hypothetical protein
MDSSKLASPLLQGEIGGSPAAGPTGWRVDSSAANSLVRVMFDWWETAGFG